MYELNVFWTLSALVSFNAKTSSCASEDCNKYQIAPIKQKASQDKGCTKLFLKDTTQLIQDSRLIVQQWNTFSYLAFLLVWNCTSRATPQQVRHGFYFFHHNLNSASYIPIRDVEDYRHIMYGDNYFLQI